MPKQSTNTFSHKRETHTDSEHWQMPNAPVKQYLTSPY